MYWYLNSFWNTCFFHYNGGLASFQADYFEIDAKPITIWPYDLLYIGRVPLQCAPPPYATLTKSPFFVSPQAETLSPTGKPQELSHMPRSGSNSHDQWGSYSGFTSENAIPSRPPAPLYDADFIRDQPQELPFPVKQTFRGKTATVARSATPALIVPTKRASSGKTVGRSNVGQHAHSPVEDPKYLHSEDYPFGGGQPDRESENLLVSIGDEKMA